MKRRKITKVRTTISIDSKVFEESGDYIYNLSAFVEECMRREIAKQKDKKNRDLLRISTNKQTTKEDVSVDDVIKMLDEFDEKYKKTPTNDVSVDDVIKMLEEY